MQRGLLTGIILGVAMVIFTLQNEVRVPVKIFWFKANDVPLALILMISILIGVSVTVIFAFIDNQKLKNRIKRLQIKLKEFENPTSDSKEIRETGNSDSDNGLIIEGDPGHKFFDY